MTQTFVTGQLGSGKSLYVIDKIRTALWEGRKVATNIDIDLCHLLGPFNRNARLIRLPDHPTLQDMEGLPYGGRIDDSYDDADLGEIYLDECATFLNSRTSMDKNTKDSRLEFIDWMIHCRKNGWNCCFIVQNYEMIDKQVRIGLMEFLVICKRLDKINIPILGGLLNLFGFAEALKIHTATKIYTGTSTGNPEKGIHVENEMYKSHDLYDAYNTRQKFDKYYRYSAIKSDSAFGGYVCDPLTERSNVFGNYSVIPPGYYVGNAFTEGYDPLKHKFKSFVGKASRWGRVGATLFTGALIPIVANAITNQPKESIDVAAKAEPVEYVETVGKEITLEGLVITGHMQLGSVTEMYFEQDGQVINSTQLQQTGHKLFMASECEARITTPKGERYVSRCKTQTTDDDYAHLPDGKSLASG